MLQALFSIAFCSPSQNVRLSLMIKQKRSTLIPITFYTLTNTAACEDAQEQNPVQVLQYLMFLAKKLINLWIISLQWYFTWTIVCCNVGLCVTYCIYNGTHTLIPSIGHKITETLMTLSTKEQRINGIMWFVFRTTCNLVIMILWMAEGTKFCPP